LPINKRSIKYAYQAAVRDLGFGKANVSSAYSQYWSQSQNVNKCSRSAAESESEAGLKPQGGFPGRRILISRRPTHPQVESGQVKAADAAAADSNQV